MTQLHLTNMFSKYLPTYSACWNHFLYYREISSGLTEIGRGIGVANWHSSPVGAKRPATYTTFYNSLQGLRMTLDWGFFLWPSLPSRLSLWLDHVETILWLTYYLSTDEPGQPRHFTIWIHSPQEHHECNSLFCISFYNWNKWVYIQRWTNA